MANINDYLKMQKDHYEQEANKWSLQNKNPVVGGYHKHNDWKDYDEYLFKNFETKDLIALDYGTGPGRNIIKFRNRFKRIDGVDIGANNIKNAKINLDEAKITGSNLYVCDGKSIPVESETYDVVFSVICLQHIACYDIRYSIFEDIFRVLKSGGKFCFQMGYGGRDTSSHNYQVYERIKNIRTASYYENATDANQTNGYHDVTVGDASELEKDLTKIGFKEFLFDIRPTGPGCSHKSWIYTQVTKP
jgi:SAM-dependent methyltransferase